MNIELEIDNYYDGDKVRTHVVADVEAPPYFVGCTAQDIEEVMDKWAEKEIMPHTGTGRPEGNSAYFVKVTACDDPALVGRTFEFG